MKKLLLLLLLVPWLAKAQTTVTGNIMVGTLATRPASCSPGDQYNTTDGNGAALCNPVSGTWQNFQGASSSILPTTVIAFSATPAFNGTVTAAYSITLTGNVTSSSVTGSPVNGTLMGLHICQGAGGPWTFAFPAGFLNTTTIQTTSCTDETYKFDGTNWSQLTQPAGAGGGGGSSVGGQCVLQAAGTAGAFQSTNLCEAGGVLNNGDDNILRGPNPSGVDVRKFGARAVNPNAVPAPTATINSGSNSAVVSANTGLVIGDGFSIVGAGLSQSMTTPTAPTVTPVCAAGPLGSGFVVPAGAGGTTRNWSIAMRDKGQGLTAASPDGTTTTGNANPGARSTALTNTVDGIANTFTSTVASSSELAPGCMIILKGSTDDAEFGGWKIVTSVPDGTHITWVSGVNAAIGITTNTATGGTVQYFLGDHLALPLAGANGHQYEIYGTTAGSETKIGESLIASLGYTDTLYNTWDYWGPTISGNYVNNWWAPTTPPVSPTNDTLVTTITNIAGTTLTLAANASNSVTGAQASFDNAPNIAACFAAANVFTTGGGGTCRFPVVVENAGTGNYCYPISTFLDATGVNAIIQDGTVCLRDTLKFNGNWYGTDLAAKRLIAPGFSLRAHIPIFIFGANPGIWTTGGGLNKVDVDLLGNGQVGVFNTPQGGAQIFEDDSFFSGISNDYSSIPFYDYGSSVNGGFGLKIRNSSFISASTLGGGQAQVGQTATPAFISKFNTLLNFDYISCSTRGFDITPFSSGLSGRFIMGEECQGPIMPTVSFQPYFGGTTGGYFTLVDMFNDTGSAPQVAYFPTATATLGANIHIDGANSPAGQQPIVSGSPFSSVEFENLGATTGLQLGQNMNTTVIGMGNSFVPGIKTASLAVGAVVKTASYTPTKSEGIVILDGTGTITIDTTLGDGQAWDVYCKSGTCTLAASAGTLHGNGATGSFIIPANTGQRVTLKLGDAYAEGGGGGGGGGCTPGGTTDALLYNGGGGTCAGVNSPTANGNYNVHYRVTTSAAVPPAIDLPGIPINVQAGTTYVEGSGNTDFDRFYLIIAGNAGAQTYTLGNPAATGFGQNYSNVLDVIAAGAVTENASGFSVNGGASFVTPSSWMRWLFSDGVNYRAEAVPTARAFPTCLDAGGNHYNNDANGNIVCGTSASGNGLSGMTAGQIPVAATATSVTSSKPLAGAGAGIVTGPTTSVSTDLVDYIGTAGQTADSGVLLANVWRKEVANVSAAVNHDFSAGTWKWPTAAGFTSSATSMSGYDSTAKIPHCWTNNADSICVATTTTSTTVTNILHATATPDLYTPSAIVTADLPAQYTRLECSPGLGDGLNAITAGTYLQFNCVNKSGVTWTITGISCWTDNAGTSTLNAANNAATGLLTGAVTCNNTKSAGGAAGTQSGTTTLANNDAISFTFVADGTSKQSTWTVSLTQ